MFRRTYLTLGAPSPVQPPRVSQSDSWLNASIKFDAKYTLPCLYCLYRRMTAGSRSSSSELVRAVSGRSWGCYAFPAHSGGHASPLDQTHIKPRGCEATVHRPRSRTCCMCTASGSTHTFLPRLACPGHTVIIVRAIHWVLCIRLLSGDGRADDCTATCSTGLGHPSGLPRPPALSVCALR